MIAFGSGRVRVARDTLAGLAIAVATFGGALVLTGCGSDEGKERPKIAFLVPEGAGTHFALQDEPIFRARVAQLCPRCEVRFYDARGNPVRQVAQGAEALKEDFDVLAIDPVNPLAMSLARTASESNIPVVNYDNLLEQGGADFFVGPEPHRIGRVQARALLAKLHATSGAKKVIVDLGAPADNFVHQQTESAALGVLRGQVLIGAQFDVPGSSSTLAERDMAKAIARLGRNGFSAVYTVDASIAAGAIKAMRAAGIDPSTRPVVSVGADLESVRLVLRGDEYLTVYTPIKPEAELAAALAASLAKNGNAHGPGVVATGVVRNKGGTVTALLVPPKVVTRIDVKRTVVADGLLTATQLCSRALRSACAAAGLK